jgi:hypothetical protein
MYRVIYIGTRRPIEALLLFSVAGFARSLDRKPASFFQKTVHHLFIATDEGDYANDILRTLTVCSGVTNLVMDAGTNSEDLSLLCPTTTTSLQRLSIDLGDTSLLTHLVLCHVTHLELFDYYPPEKTVHDLSLMPNLTHLAVIWHWGRQRPWNSGTCPLTFKIQHYST